MAKTETMQSASEASWTSPWFQKWKMAQNTPKKRVRFAWKILRLYNYLYEHPWGRMHLNDNWRVLFDSNCSFSSLRQRRRLPWSQKQKADVSGIWNKIPIPTRFLPLSEAYWNLAENRICVPTDENEQEIRAFPPGCTKRMKHKRHVVSINWLSIAKWKQLWMFVF